MERSTSQSARSWQARAVALRLAGRLRDAGTACQVGLAHATDRGDLLAAAGWAAVHGRAAGGLTSHEIARRLRLSVRTVDNHLRVGHPPAAPPPTPAPPAAIDRQRLE